MVVWIKISVVKGRPEFVLSEQAENFFVLGILAKKGLTENRILNFEVSIQALSCLIFFFSLF